MANEHRVASVSDLSPGQMKNVEAGETPLLLSNVEGEIYAVSGTCTHYGAPLADGALSGKQVICPWHHACFDVTTGDHLEPPGLNALQRFEVRVDGDDIFVTLPDEVAERKPKATGKKDDEPVFVILGGGIAGESAAEVLRDEGFGGRLVLVSKETYSPYDRTKLSKQLGAAEDAGALELRDEAFYKERDIERLTAEATAVDVAGKTVTFKDAEPLSYDKLLVATGSTPRALDTPGADLDNIFQLRSLNDAQRILAAAQAGDRAVLVGSSFIALELANALQEQEVSVSVVAPESVPFEKVLGERVGKKVQQNHEAQKVAFHLGQKVETFEGNGKVTRAVLENGTELDADFVVVGIGVTPVTDFLSGVDKAEDGGVKVAADLKAAEDVWAVGDIAQFPLKLTGEQVRIEHWRLAAQHGRTAARNMLGQNATYDGVPYFWSAQPDLKLRYVGHAEGFDDVVYEGDVEAGEFIAYYVKDGAIHAAAGVGKDKEMAALEHLMKQGKTPKPDEVRQVKLLELL